MSNKWQVLVGNIGEVYSTSRKSSIDDEMLARKIYWQYVEYSHNGYGRAAFEPVTLIYDGDIILSHDGTIKEKTK